MKRAIRSSTECESGAPAGKTIWSSSAAPSIPWNNDAPATLGVKFRSDVNGNVTGIRFYKGAGNNGTHIGLLYSSTGTPLAQATFSGETASGWQQVNFSSAVSIAANTTYIAAFFTTSGYDGWPLVMLRLAEVDASQLAELVTNAWRMRAPR